MRLLHRVLLPLLATPLLLAGLGAPTASATGPGSSGHGSHRPSTAYVALGDSFSSGQGTGDYIAGTDDWQGNSCRRSLLAYPALLQQRYDLEPFAFVACSGAETYDLTHANHLYAGEPAQLDALSRSTRFVSLTIGGNDLGFGDVIQSCLYFAPSVNGWGCSTNPAVTGPVAARLDALAGRSRATTADGLPITDLKTVLAQIHAKAPRASIFFAGYPELFGSDPADFEADPYAPSGSICVVGPFRPYSLDHADTTWINRQTRAYNRVLKRSIAAARRADPTLRAHYVSPRRFDGHGLCDAKTAWINAFLYNNIGTFDPGSFHPTAQGQRSGYRPAFERAALRG